MQDIEIIRPKEFDKENPRLSVIIPTNKSDISDLEVSEALSKQENKDFEVIISLNYGEVSRARNKAVENSKSDRIIFLDDDAIPDEKYVDNAIEALDNHSIIRGKVIHPKNNFFSQIINYYDLGNKKIETESLLSGNMAIRKPVFQEIGGFDEVISWGHEDTELAHRIKNTKYKIYYIPELVIEHPYADTALDYYRKMWNFGKIDIYYWYKTRTRIKNIAASIIPYTRKSDTIKGKMILSVGNIIRDISMLVSIPKWIKFRLKTIDK